MFAFCVFSKNNNFNSKFLFGVLLFILDSTYGSFRKIDLKINTAPKNTHFPLSKLRSES